MSQIQVIGREAVDDANNLRDSAQKQAELQATIADKRATLNFYSQELEYKKKVAIDDVKKAALTDKMEKAKLLLKVFDDASKSPNPQQYLSNVAKMNIDLVSDTLGDPEFQKLAQKMQPSAEEQYKGESVTALKNFNAQQQALNNPNVIADARQGLRDENVPPQQGAGDVMGAPRTYLKGFGEGGAELGVYDPQLEFEQAKNKSAGTEAGKPFSKEEIEKLATGESVAYAVNNLKSLADRGVLGSITNQTFVDIGNPILAAKMPTDVRDALDYMNQLKTIVPFLRGGKQLTPFESKLVMRLINTQGKTPEMIKRDLDVYLREVELYKALVGKARGDIDLNNLSMNFGRGKSYEELVKDTPIGATGKTVKSGKYDVSY